MEYITCIKYNETTDGLPCYVAWHPEMAGCMAQGITPEEAEMNLVEARELVISHYKEQGLFIPKPMSIERVTIDFRNLWEW